MNTIKEEPDERTRLRDLSLSLILENQHSSGAFVASPTFSQYGYSWLRDGAYIAYSVLVSGYLEETHAYINWVADVIDRYKYKVDELPAHLASDIPLINNWFFSARYTVDGDEDASDWPNFQIDGYGSWLWLVGEYLKEAKTPISAYWESCAAVVVSYLELVWNIPNSDCWEEFPEHVHPATLSCIAGGLTGIAPYVPGALATRCKTLSGTITEFLYETVHSGGFFPKYVGSETIDASLLWLCVPYNVIPPLDPAMIKTVERIEREITIEGGVKRYPQDTYYGGGRWIILSAYLGWYYLQIGNAKRAGEMLDWILAQQEDCGHLPEQVLDQVNDPSMIEPWEKMWGSVATPLLWSHAMFLILDRELSVYNQNKERTNE